MVEENVLSGGSCGTVIESRASGDTLVRGLSLIDRLVPQATQRSRRERTDLSALNLPSAS